MTPPMPLIAGDPGGPAAWNATLPPALTYPTLEGAKICDLVGQTMPKL